MADQPVSKNLLPTLLTQNPSLVETQTQDRREKVQQIVGRILETFYQVLPSNYVSQVVGPYYTVQFQAAAERLAEFQVSAQEAWADRDYDFTRPEYLFQIIGSLVFPDSESDGVPDIDGDLSYRSFMKSMVALLLQGATKATIEQGIALLTDAEIEVIEKVIAARTTPNCAWGFDDQFSFEVNLSGDAAGQSWPDGDPFILTENIRIVLRALKPAHTLYDQRFLFKETFGTLFTDSASWDMANYYYADLRRFCQGAKRLAGTAGATLTDRSLFRDLTRDFANISPGATLTVLSGANAGTYRVSALVTYLFTDPTPRAYTTSPTGLSGTCTMPGEGIISDLSQNWSLAQEGETLTIVAGPNAGIYRLKTVLGLLGGPVGFATGSDGRVRVAQSTLRLDRRMPVAVTGQSYEVVVDRLGAQTPKVVIGEDATSFFLL